MGFPLNIPTTVRLKVKIRDRFRCCRCGMSGAEWQHRRSRSVRDEHTHCTCNGIWLCSECHAWVHAHPLLARIAGWSVSRSQRQPGLEPVDCIQHGGKVLLDCDGGFAPYEEGDFSD